MSGETMSTVIHREGQYQTELFMIPFKIQKVEFHSHPNVDTYEMYVSGDFTLSKDGVPHPGAYCSELGKRPILKVFHNNIHGGEVRSGACFLSFQHWLNGVKPSSVAIDYKIDLTHPSLVNGKSGLDKETLEKYKRKLGEYK